MTDEDKEYLISVIESHIARWCDFTGFGGDGVLATRIANALEDEFAFVSYQGQDKFRTPNAKSQATDAALSRQVACTDGLGLIGSGGTKA